MKANLLYKELRPIWRKNVQHIESALRIKRTLGTFTAARYLARRNWSIEAALWLLASSCR